MIHISRIIEFFSLSYSSIPLVIICIGIICLTLAIKRTTLAEYIGGIYGCISFLILLFIFIGNSQYFRSILINNPQVLDCMFTEMDKEPRLLNFENDMLGKQVDLLDDINADNINPETQPALAQAARLQNRKSHIHDDVLSNWDIINNVTNDECGICYEKITKTALACPECGKTAHTECIRKWVRSGETHCIYCRANLVIKQL